MSDGFCSGIFILFEEILSWENFFSGEIVSGDLLKRFCPKMILSSKGFLYWVFVRGGLCSGNILSKMVLFRGEFCPRNFVRGSCPGGTCVGDLAAIISSGTDDSGGACDVGSKAMMTRRASLSVVSVFFKYLRISQLVSVKN